MKIKLCAIFLFTLCCIICFPLKEAKAENYTSFQELTFEDEDVVLIEDWSKSFELQSMYRLNIKPKMFGWYISYTYKKKKFNFVSDTLYFVRNTGKKDIEHNFKYEESNEDMVQRKVKGSLEIEGSGSKKNKFKFGLEGKVEYTYEETNRKKQSQTDSIKVVVAPNSVLTIDVRGEGYLYQGVAEKFVFWIKSKKGAFEYVIITTEYYSINMETINATNQEEDGLA